ncbi:polycystin-1-like [Physella acuta]|uniref:polycystin-1-like n=1 Tax=Physella acuta TaxID=109671 RepID=UPI0027DCFEFE|nr:polycystin-1-like [Physella acuta]
MKLACRPRAPIYPRCLMLLCWLATLGWCDESADCLRGPTGTPCTCSDALLDCTGADLQELPTHLSSSIQSINVSENLITSVNGNLLPTNLESINLTGNPVVEILGTFLSVKQLYIEHSGLKSFHVATLFCSLRILHAGHNTFSLDPQAFTCMEHLTQIKLNNLKLVELPEDIFTANKHLQHIDLSHNLLSTVSDSIFDGLDNLTFLDLSSNPWSCDCSLVWLQTFLRSLVNSGGSLFNQDTTQCSPASPTALTLTHTDTFSSCHHLSQLAKRSSEEPFDWLIVCQTLSLANSTNILCDPREAASCVYDFESQNYSLVHYMAQVKDTPSKLTCRNQCHQSGYHYFLFDIHDIHDIYDICLCGNVSSECTDCASPLNSSMTLCSGQFSNLVGGSSIFYDLDFVLWPAQPQVMTLMTLTFSNSDPCYNKFTWDFGDGSRVSQGTTPAASHLYLYPGIFELTLTLMGTCQPETIFKVNISVTYTSDPGQMTCPSSPLSTADQVNITATFTSAWGQKVMWQSEQSGTQLKEPTSCAGILSGPVCYVPSSQQASWEAAQTLCQTTYPNGQLAQAATAADNLLLARLVPSSRAWMGLKATSVPGLYIWLDGRSTSAFNNWSAGGGDGACVSLDQSGLWHTEPCQQEKLFVCQYSQEGIIQSSIY